MRGKEECSSICFDKSSPGRYSSRYYAREEFDTPHTVATNIDLQSTLGCWRLVHIAPRVWRTGCYRTSEHQQAELSLLPGPIARPKTNHTGPQTLFESIILLRWSLVKLRGPSCYLYDRLHAFAGRERGRVCWPITIGLPPHPILVGLHNSYGWQLYHCHLLSISSGVWRVEECPLGTFPMPPTHRSAEQRSVHETRSMHTKSFRGICSQMPNAKLST